jgi:hypothetical protein
MVDRTHFIAKLSLVFAVLSLPQRTEGATSKRLYPCHWVTGRLTATNGGTPVKIWPRNTNRLLGVVNDEELPAEITRLRFSFDHSIWGDFRVCPTTKERKGWMRFVIVTKGRKLNIVDYK